MLGNFEYSNPTKLYFGEDSLCSLNKELSKYGKTVQLMTHMQEREVERREEAYHDGGLLTYVGKIRIPLSKPEPLAATEKPA